MPSLRLAHLTDLHLRHHQPGCSRTAKRRCRSMPELFQRALGRAVEAGAQAIALTGDLLDVPDYILTGDDYYDYDRAFWESAVEADYLLLRDLLEATGLPYFVLPGNHDWLPVMRRVFPPEPVVDLGGYRLVSFWDRDFYAHVPRRLDRERTLMEQVLAQGGPPQIHLQHYVITPLLREGWPHSYLEGDHLRHTLAGSNQVVLSLSGHYHPGTDAIVDGRCTFTTGPAFAVFPHRWRMVTLQDDAVELETYPLLERRPEHSRPVVFLDRDGVLNEVPSWRTGPEPLTAVPGVGAALRRLHEAGYVLIVLSSQSAIGAGYVTHEVVDSVFDRLARLIWDEAGVCWDAFYYTVGAGSMAVHPDWVATEDAKPSAYWLNAARDLFDLRLAGSYFIGDNLSDLQAGVAAGVTPVLVRTGHGRQVEPTLAKHPELAATLVVDDIGAGAEVILAGGS